MSVRSTSWLSWAAAGTGLALFGATVWFIGPLLAVGGVRPLESAAARGIVIALLLAGFAPLLWRRLRPAAGTEVDLPRWLIERAVAEAALRLATPAGPAPGIGRQLRSLFAGPPPQARLYQRPWVLAIGTPGCDKTRALAAAGLAPSAGTADKAMLGWTIRPTGVLFDAGELPCRGGDTWTTLLAQLRKARPLRPLNAVLVCVSAGELVGPAAAAEAPALAARLAELAKAIDPWLPVALVVTHAERIDGFPGDAARRRLDEAVRAFDLGIAPKAVAYAGDDDTVLRRFVEDEVFAAARATPVDAEAVKRLRLRMALAYLALPLAFAALVYALAGSRQHNHDLAVAVAQRVPQAAAELDGLRSRGRGDPTADPELYLKLSALRADAVIDAAAPGSVGLGLDQRPKLAAAVESHYHRQLGASLGARFRTGIESELRAADPAEPARLYLLLRAYLDLGERDSGPAVERAARARAIAPVLLDILRKPMADPETEVLAAMALHIDDCLAHCELGAQPVDQVLVARASAALADFPLEARLQAQLASAVAGSMVGNSGSVSMASLGLGSPVLADGDAAGGAVPAVYTARGFTEFAQRLFTDIRPDTVRRASATTGLVTAPDIDIEALRQRVLRRQAEDGVRAWDGYLASLRIVRPSDPAAWRTGLERLASNTNDSPLMNLLNTVAGETAPLRDVSATVLQWPEARVVSDHFAPLRQALAGSPSPAATALSTWPSLAGNQASRLAADLESQAASLPEPLRSLQMQLARASGSGGAGQANATPERALSPVQVVDLATLESGAGADLASAAVVLGAVGDSWFSYGALNPTRTSNLLGELRLPDATVVVNASSPAPRPDGALDASAAQRLFRSRRWDAVLASLGLWRVVAALADPKQPLLVSSNAGVGASLSPTALRLLEQQIRADVRALVQARDATPNRGVPIVLHTYDHPTPRPAGAGPGQGPWLQPAMAAAGVPTADQRALARALIDELARILAAIAQDSKQYPGLVLVDTRGTLAPAATDAIAESGDWLTELSPTRAGYAKLAQRWRSSPAFRVATGATTAQDRRVPAAQPRNAVEAVKQQLIGDIKKAR